MRLGVAGHRLYSGCQQRQRLSDPALGGVDHAKIVQALRQGTGRCGDRPRVRRDLHLAREKRTLEDCVQTNGMCVRGLGLRKTSPDQGP